MSACSCLGGVQRGIAQLIVFCYFVFPAWRLLIWPDIQGYWMQGLGSAARSNGTRAYKPMSYSIELRSSYCETTSTYGTGKFGGEGLCCATNQDLRNASSMKVRCLSPQGREGSGFRTKRAIFTHWPICHWRKIRANRPSLKVRSYRRHQ